METAQPRQRVFLLAASYGNVRQEKTKLDINFNLLARRWNLTEGASPTPITNFLGS
jgi:hypothetical protein